MKLGESGSVTPLNEEALSSPAVSLLQLNHQKVPRLVLDSFPSVNDVTFSLRKTKLI